MGLHEGGWRDLQSSNLGNFYGDLGWLGNAGEVHINVTAAQTRLNGPGTSPVELLGVNPSAQFTAPNLIKNKYTQVNLCGSYDINDTTSLQGLVYYTYLLQKVYNSNVPDLSPCNNGSGLLCEAPGVVGTGLNGNPIPDFMKWRSLFGSRSAIDQYEWLWRFISGDQPRRVVWSPQPVYRRFQF
jgi:iron complex outermembrane recepter protein